MTRTKKGAALIATLPPDRVLLESDGPYAVTRGRAARPDDLHHVVSMLAAAWNQRADVTAALLQVNVDTLTKHIGA